MSKNYNNICTNMKFLVYVRLNYIKGLIHKYIFLNNVKMLNTVQNKLKKCNNDYKSLRYTDFS